MRIYLQVLFVEGVRIGPSTGFLEFDRLLLGRENGLQRQHT